MKKEMIQTRNRKMNKKMIMKNEIIPEEDWTNNDDWLKSYNLTRATLLEQRERERLEERGEEDLEEDASIGEMIAPFTHTEDSDMGDIKQDEEDSGDLSLCH